MVRDSMIPEGKSIVVIHFVILCILIGISHISIDNIQYIYFSIPLFPACRSAILNLIKCSMLRYSVRSTYKLSSIRKMPKYRLILNYCHSLQASDKFNTTHVLAPHQILRQFYSSHFHIQNII